jgi:hypothetical protein
MRLSLLRKYGEEEYRQRRQWLEEILTRAVRLTVKALTMATDVSANLITLLALGLVLGSLLFLPKPWGRTARRVGILSFALLVFAGFAALVITLIAKLSLGDTGYTGLTYEEYKSCVGLNGLDPVGASDICFRCDQAIDAHDTWQKLRIPTAAFDSLLAQRSVDMQNLHFASYNGEAARPVRKVVSDRGTIPSGWPKPMRTPPPWWDAPMQGPGLQCTYWELQVSTGSGSSRAKGWYWLYDPNKTTLWIWEWNHQHIRLE